MIRIGFFGLLIMALSYCQQQEAPDFTELPYYGDASFTPTWFASTASIPSDFHRIPAFSLQNQLGDTITEEDVTGKTGGLDRFQLGHDLSWSLGARPATVHDDDVAELTAERAPPGILQRHLVVRAPPE